MRVTSALVAAASLFGSSLAAPAPSNPTRTIGIGTIVGRTSVVTSASSTATVNQFLGIPLAAVPTGSLRFAPPQPATKLKSPLQATSLPPACIQQFPYPAGSRDFEMHQYNNPQGPPPQETEDCLYINVYTPQSASSSNKKAVMFWLFGGDFQFGTGSIRYYNGSFFAGFQDIVIVTFNFRNNLFGFPSSPEIPLKEQNVGLLDQRFALQWVQDNIAAFGGDPNQVTIAGESSGGWGVKQLLAFPPSPRPFRAGIIESSAANVSANNNDEYGNLTAHFNCASAASPLNCLRQVPAADLKDYLDHKPAIFNPVTDNITCANDVRPRIMNKQMANVPVIFGTNKDEARVFLAQVGLNTANGINQTAEDQFAQMFFPNNPLAQAAIKGFGTGAGQMQFEGLAQIVTDLAFTCPISAWGNLAMTYGYSNLYRFWYTATFPNVENFPDAGAYHSAELPTVWGTYDFPSPLGPYTAQQAALSGKMNKAWGDFIKNPSGGPGQGWNRLNNPFSNVARFDTDGVHQTNQFQPDMYCPGYSPIIAAGPL